MIYLVTTQEVWTAVIEIEASSPEEARQRVDDGEGEMKGKDAFYSYTLDANTWKVQEKECKLTPESPAPGKAQ